MMTDSGLTLVEAMMVLLLIGIVATLAVPSLDGVFTQTRIDAAATWLIGDIRYAQSLAIHTQQSHTVKFDATTEEYRLVDQNGTMVQHPLTRQEYRVSFGSLSQLQGIDLLAATFGASNNLSFDALGAPQNGGTVTLSYANRQRTITVTYPTGRVLVP